MAKNLKTLLKIFTLQRHDIRDAQNSILYALNNEVSATEKTPVSNFEEAKKIRECILGKDSIGLTKKELKILQEMALSWGNIEQTITAINLFLRQYRAGTPFKIDEIRYAKYKSEFDESYFLEHNDNNENLLPKIRPAGEYNADNDLHIFLSKEHYWIDDKKIRTINPNVVNKIAEYTPATADLIFYENLVEMIPATIKIPIYENDEFTGRFEDKEVKRPNNELYAAFSKRLHYWEFLHGIWKKHIVFEEDEINYKQQEKGFTPVRSNGKDWYEENEDIWEKPLIQFSLFQENIPDKLVQSMKGLFDTDKDEQNNCIKYTSRYFEGEIVNNCKNIREIDYPLQNNSILYKILERKGCSYAKN